MTCVCSEICAQCARNLGRFARNFATKFGEGRRETLAQGNERVPVETLSWKERDEGLRMLGGDYRCLIIVVCVSAVLCLVCLPLRVRPRVCPVPVLRF